MCGDWNCLCKSNNGDIYRSACGCGYKLYFNNVVMRMDFVAFEHFYNEVMSCYETVHKEHDKTTRSLCFQTKMENMVLVFSVQEISELHYLMESSFLKVMANA